MMTTPSCNPTQSDPLPSDPPSSAPPQNAPTRSGSQSDRPGGLRVRRFALHFGLVLPFKLAAVVGVAYALVAAGVAQPVPLAMGFALLPLTGVFLPRPSSVPDLVTPHPPRRRESTY